MGDPIASSSSSTRSPGEGLKICVARKLNAIDLLDALIDPFILRGTPDYIRSDNGPEFVATSVRDWIAAVGARSA